MSANLRTCIVAGAWPLLEVGMDTTGNVPAIIQFVNTHRLTDGLAP